jgi:hypothetical protein
LEYTAKATVGHKDNIFIPFMEEVYLLINQKRSKKPSLDDFISQQVAQPELPAQPGDDTSIINTVTDFSPPADWLDEDE